MIAYNIMDISECLLNNEMVNLDPELDMNKTMCSPFTNFEAI